MIKPKPQFSGVSHQGENPSAQAPKKVARAGETPASHPWWKVMCLSGVDYFSTLGYQPGIAVMAAGVLAPVATLLLVAVTLLGVVPVYRRIAQQSPEGLGSVALIARLVHGWKGAFIILVLLGFALTDFMITITLSCADAATHVLHSASSPWIIPVTVAFVCALAGVFLRGFREAVGVAVVLVVAYLALNAVVIGRCFVALYADPTPLAGWWQQLSMAGAHPADMALVACLVFPKLALGLSGFETGVSVMPLIRAHSVEQRVRCGKVLLAVSAALMCGYLVCSSIVTTVLIPEAALHAGGPADGRALSWLAHQYLGQGFGACYDLASVAILWFAGASAMSGMLALIPRYLPRMGMAPQWARRRRPMVVALSVIAVVVTVAFEADVDRQSGAYATGVLVLLVSGAAAVSVTSRSRKARVIGGVTTAVLGYTLVANIVERPDGLKVGACFIVGIVVVSVVSRAWRSFELRDGGVSFDTRAENIIRAAGSGSQIALVPCRQGVGADGLASKEVRVRSANGLEDESLIFVAVTLSDPATFAGHLTVRGSMINSVPVLTCTAPSVANAVAVVALAIQSLTQVSPDIYFEWAPGNPLCDMIRFIATGRGQNATATQEMLRRFAPDGRPRPQVHIS
ncbi:amino acid transporter [Corynebacterium uberis]|uniref:amino acid transporter n=1 Tax=Corynebacterium uberis TaxID=2883169 RepID=UPI003D160BF9